MYLYTESVLSVVSQTNVIEIAQSINAVFILFASFLVFFMQPGFALLEAGQVQAKNVANVAMKNLMDWSQGVLSYFFIGSGVAFIAARLTSTATLSVTEAFAYVNDPSAWITWLFGAVFAMTASTIVSGAVAGRIRFSAYILLGFLMTSLIYPVVEGLVWRDGLLTTSGYIGGLIGAGYMDFAGATVVHMTGGVAGLAAAAYIGPRRIRFDDNRLNVVPGHSVFLAMLGTLLLAFGWYGFNVGTHATVLSEDGIFEGAALGRVALNTTHAMGAGTMAAALVTTIHRGKPDPLFAANGMLAGLVAVTGAAGYVTWWGGIILGAIGGALVMPVHRMVVTKLRIDDVCAVFSVHGVAGAVGTLLIPLFAVGSDGSWQILGTEQLLIQVIGVATIALWTAAATIGSLMAIETLLGKTLRVDEAAEQLGLDASEHNITAYPEFALTDGGRGGTSTDDATDTPISRVDGSNPTTTQSAAARATDTQPSTTTTMWRGQEVEISHKTEYERELEALTNRLELTLEETNTGVWEWNLDTKEYIMDEAAERLLGFDPGEFDHRYETFIECVHPEDQDAVEHAIEEAVESKEPIRTDFRIQLSEDNQCWLQSRGVYKDADGSKRLFGIHTDITDEKQRQQALETANERLDNFAGFVSHDLRNPLGIARTYLGFAEETGDADDFAAVDSALDRMNEMIDGFLKLASIEDDSLDRQPISIADHATEAWRSVDTKSATLDIDADTTLSADPEFLLHVFENLFRNSIEHGGEDVTVTVGLLADLPGFYIADDGPGISPENRETILEHGYTSSDNGSGYGMSIVGTVVEVHGWKLSVTESETGGARFEIVTD